MTIIFHILHYSKIILKLLICLLPKLLEHLTKVENLFHKYARSRIMKYNKFKCTIIFDTTNNDKQLQIISKIKKWLSE